MQENLFKTNSPPPFGWVLGTMKNRVYDYAAIREFVEDLEREATDRCVAKLVNCDGNILG